MYIYIYIYCHIFGVPWRIITGSGSDDWFIGTSLQLQSTITAHNHSLSTARSIPYWTASVFSPAVTNHCSHTELPWTTSVCRVPHSSQVKSYVTTDGQPASLSWNKASIWGLRPDLYYCLTVAGFLILGALFNERTGLSFAIPAGPRQRSHFLVRVP
jgi:hypothetical protein